MSSRYTGSVAQPQLAILGVDYQSAPIQIREVLSFTASEASAFLTQARQHKIIESGVLLSTCNRMQLFVESYLGASELKQHLTRFVLEYKGMPITYRKYFIFSHEEKAIPELLLLASGYLSMVRGETQILGQIKEAVQVARSSGNCSKVLLRLFDKALEVSKKIRSTQEVWAVNRSAGQAAVEYLVNLKGREALRNGKHLIIGAGQMAATVVQALQQLGCQHIALYNRTAERGERFASKYGMQLLYSGEELSTSISCAEYLWVATSASSAILDKTLLSELSSPTQTIFDLGLPRNVAPNVAELPHVALFCIDHLDTHLAVENEIPEEVLGIINIGVEEFVQWREGLKMRDVFSVIRNETEELAQNELQKIGNGVVDAHILHLLERYSLQVANAYSSTLIARLRRLSDETNDPIYAEVVRQLFSL